MNDALVKIMLKNLGVDPEILKAQAAQGFETMKQAAARMERIENALILICAKLGIQPPLPAQEIQNASHEIIDGNASAH